MRWLRRFLGLPEDGWPTRTPPTTGASGPPVFHCPACKAAVPSDAARCPRCSADLL